MTHADIRANARKAVAEALGPLGDDEAIAEVLAVVDGLPFTGDVASFTVQVAAAARSVWERKVQAASARADQAEQQLRFETAWSAATPHVQPSQHTH